MSNTLNEKEREEVSRIAYGYEDHPESDMDRLRKLDAKAKDPRRYSRIRSAYWARSCSAWVCVLR